MAKSCGRFLKPERAPPTRAGPFLYTGRIGSDGGQSRESLAGAVAALLSEAAEAAEAAAFSALVGGGGIEAAAVEAAELAEAPLAGVAAGIGTAIPLPRIGRSEPSSEALVSPSPGSAFALTRLSPSSRDFLGGDEAVVVAVPFLELFDVLAGMPPFMEGDLPVAVGVELP